jgi:hypothetical protein
MNPTTRIIFPRAYKPFFWVKTLKFFDADPGCKNSDPGPRIWNGKKSDPGFATLDVRPFMDF